MGTVIKNLQFSSLATANFNQWAGGIEDAILGFGWTLSTETGSLDPHSAAVPAAGAYIFRIYKMADALQATRPIFMKIRYGKSATGTCPAVGVSFGQGSNGAGVLTGYVTTEIVHAPTVGVSATTTPCYFSGDTNRFMMVLWETVGRTVGSQAPPMFIQCERSVDNTGAVTGDYLFYIGGWGSTQKQCQTVWLATSSAPAEEITGMPVVWPTVRTWNSKIYFVPFLPIIGQIGNPQFGGFAFGTDVTHLSVETLSFYGVAHTFIVMTHAQGPYAYAVRNSDGGIFLRYE